MKYPNCKYSNNPENSIYCGGYGIRLIKKCESCGFGYSSWVSRFCGICGNRFNDDWMRKTEFKSEINNPLPRKVAFCTRCGHRFQRYDDNNCPMCYTDRKTFISL